MQAWVIGGGLAGSEAAWQLAKRGIEVTMYEMRPHKNTGAHEGDRLGELVCSNSLGGANITGASGLLKEELRKLDSLVIRSADQNRVPAGGALAVDREGFAELITREIEAHPLIKVVREELTELPEGPGVVASGPLTSSALAERLKSLLGQEHLHFYDAAAPIVTYESLDHSVVWPQSRYDKGDGVYLNCPMSQEEYQAFYDALISAEGTVLHLAGEKDFFEGCLPVEVLARRGVDTLRYGPMKPVGLRDPRYGKRPHAVVQLRQDNVAGTLYNLVGFQNQLKFGEQARVFRMIPGLEKAEFVRYGVMHRNTYLNSPKFLKASLEWQEGIYFAGQLIGVEGYTESMAMGALAGINLARRLHGQEALVLPLTTMLGSLSNYVAHAEQLQPMNSNWGILPPLEEHVRDKQKRREMLAARALKDFEASLN